MTHGRWHYWNESERRSWQNPEAILADIGMRPGLTFLDIGCGPGFFSMPAARIAGAAGKVYGLDIDNSAIEELRKQAAREGLDNLELRVGQAEEMILCEACADIVFLGIVLHDFQDPARVLDNARRMLKPGGSLANLDWKKQSMRLGPPEAIRFDETTASRMIQSAGFWVERIQDTGPYHYLIVARPA